MTYKEKLKELYDTFAEKSQDVLKADNTISETNGFGDINEMTDYQKADINFKIAGNNYHNFVSYCKNYVIDMESEFPI
jgi:hypothetical protein